MAYTRKTSDIFISEQLREFLCKFENSSLVAKLLLKSRHVTDMLVDGHVNYISIAKDPTKISYLTHDRSFKISSDEYWSASCRFSAKPGSFVGKIFKNIPSREVEIFSNLFKLQTEQDQYKFEVVSGNEIAKWYKHDTYQSQSSSLGNSCMKHDHCQNYFSIYTENPEVCKLLIMLDTEGMLVGRSLIWTLPDVRIMDRIYTVNDDKLTFQFKNWADINGYFYKQEQKWNNSLFFESKGEAFERKISIDLVNFDPEWRLPYMDTFKFCNINSGRLYNHLPESHRSIRTLMSSDGGRYDWDTLAMDDATHIFYHRCDIMTLSYCEMNVHGGSVFYSESNDRYILKTHAIWMEQIRDYVFNEEFNHLNNIENIQNRVKRYSEMATRRSMGSSEWHHMVSNLGSTTLSDIESMISRGVYDTADRNAVINLDLGLDSF